MSRHAVTFAFVTLLALAPAFAAPAAAQEQVRVRGTIERMEGDLYVIKTRAGSEVKVKLGEKPMVVALIKASLEDMTLAIAFARSLSLPSARVKPSSGSGTFSL